MSVAPRAGRLRAGRHVGGGVCRHRPHLLHHRASALDMLRLYHVLHQQGVRLMGRTAPAPRPSAGAKSASSRQHPPARTGGRRQPVGTLTYEVVRALTDEGIGQSTCVGIGGDPIVGTSFIEVLDLFEADGDTEAVVLIGDRRR